MKIPEKIRRRFASLLALVSGLGVQAQASMGEPYSIWPAAEIPVRVCWAEPATDFNSLHPSAQETLREHFLAKQKALLPLQDIPPQVFGTIQSSVEEEFTFERTRISFTGWKKCSEDPEAKIAVFFTRDPSIGGQARIGKNSVKMRLTRSGALKAKGWFTPNRRIVLSASSKPGRSYVLIAWRAQLDARKVKVFPNAPQIRVAAVHEFGHAAGLQHEHWDRAAILKDPFCARANPSALERMLDGEDYFGSSTPYSKHDGYSIMSYCYVGLLQSLAKNAFDAEDLARYPLLRRVNPPLFTSSIGLSEGDRHGLKCLYDARYRQTRDCSADFNPYP